MRKLPLALLVSAIATTSAYAQNINVDVGTFFGTPSSAYGAAAGQAGTWNAKSAIAASALVDISGAATGATLAANAGNLGFGFDNAGTTGDDGLLMDDACDGVRTWTFSGVANGDYQLYTYAWAPDSSAFVTNVSVPGSTSGDQQVGGAWAGSHQLGVTYALHDISVTSGTITVNISTVVSFSTTNGFQLVEAGGGCPTPFTYCTAKVTSSSCVPVIGFTGGNDVSAPLDFAITGSQLQPTQPAVVIWSAAGQNSSPFQGGFLCIAPPVNRLSPQSTGGAAACSGTISQPAAQGVLSTIGAGNTAWFQIWFRDGGDAFGSGLTDGLEVPICP